MQESTPPARSITAKVGSIILRLPKSSLTLVLTLASIWSLALALVYPIFLDTPAHAAPLNTCAGNCHGVVNWPNGILGAISWIETVNLYSVTTGSNHISEELWLLDDNPNHTCYINSAPQNGAWVETGEATQIGLSGYYYFWADCRPGSTLLKHWEYQPPHGDLGVAMEYLIDKSASGQFQINATNTVTDALLFYGTSTSNSMSANEIEVGLETTNNSNSVTHADNDYFTHNQYHGLNGVWNYQAVTGSVIANNPPHWYWNVPPASGNHGGQGETTCC